MQGVALSAIVSHVSHRCSVIMSVSEAGHPHCHCPLYPGPNLKLEALRSCVCVGDTVELTLPLITVCAVSPHRQRAPWRPGVWSHSGTCRRGARTATGVRCNLWRVQFDYRTGTVTTLALCKCWDRLIWQP